MNLYKICLMFLIVPALVSAAEPALKKSKDAPKKSKDPQEVYGYDIYTPMHKQLTQADYPTWYAQQEEKVYKHLNTLPAEIVKHISATGGPSPSIMGFLIMPVGLAQWFAADVHPILNPKSAFGGRSLCAAQFIKLSSQGDHFIAMNPVLNVTYVHSNNGTTEFDRNTPGNTYHPKAIGISEDGEIVSDCYLDSEQLLVALHKKDWDGLYGREWTIAYSDPGEVPSAIPFVVVGGARQSGYWAAIGVVHNDVHGNLCYSLRFCKRKPQEVIDQEHVENYEGNWDEAEPIKFPLNYDKELPQPRRCHFAADGTCKTLVLAGKIYELQPDGTWQEVFKLNNATFGWGEPFDARVKHEGISKDGHRAFMLADNHLMVVERDEQGTWNSKEIFVFTPPNIALAQISGDGTTLVAASDNHMVGSIKFTSQGVIAQKVGASSPICSLDCNYTGDSIAVGGYNATALLIKPGICFGELTLSQLLFVHDLCKAIGPLKNNYVLLKPHQIQQFKELPAGIKVGLLKSGLLTTKKVVQEVLRKQAQQLQALLDAKRQKEQAVASLEESQEDADPVYACPGLPARQATTDLRDAGEKSAAAQLLEQPARQEPAHPLLGLYGRLHTIAINAADYDRHRTNLHALTTIHAQQDYVTTQEQRAADHARGVDSAAA